MGEEIPQKGNLSSTNHILSTLGCWQEKYLKCLFLQNVNTCTKAEGRRVLGSTDIPKYTLKNKRCWYNSPFSLLSAMYLKYYFRQGESLVQTLFFCFLKRMLYPYSWKKQVEKCTQLLLTLCTFKMPWANMKAQINKLSGKYHDSYLWKVQFYFLFLPGLLSINVKQLLQQILL